MRRILILAALLTLGTVAVSPVVAQITAVPNSMNFQGRLATPNGNPVADGTYSVRFSLHDALTAGTEKWNQTVASVQVKNGVFAVTLDAFPAETFNGNLWLEIKIGEDDALAPRTSLVSVPYAMKSDIALTVPDGSITNAKLAGGITADKFADNLFNPLAWLLGGNSGVTSGFLGTTDTNPLEFRVNNRRVMRYTFPENGVTRSVNVLGGSESNEIAADVIGATIAGGGWDGITIGNSPNRALANHTTISGGIANTARGGNSTIGGGSTNSSNGLLSFIGGGYGHTAGGDNSTIGGGYYNNASSTASTVAGGSFNTASGVYSTVAGGFQNTASGNFSFVGGGSQNIASGYNSFAAGQGSRALHNGTFVWADDNFGVFSSTGAQQFCVRASGGVKLNGSGATGTYLELGFGVSGKEVSAGKIGYALFTAGALDIVGAGTVGSNRKIKLWAEGGVTATGSYTNISDARYKQNVALLPNALQDILDLRGVTFHWKPTPGMNFSERNQIGFIAQEVETVLPDLVFTDEQGYKAVNYTGVIPVLVEAVKTLKKNNDTTKKENAELRATLVEVLKRLDTLEGRNK